MAVNYEKCIQILAESFKQLYGKMAKKQTDSYTVKASRKIDTDDYLVGVAVPYQIQTEQIDGQFLIGLTGRQKAVQLASAIAGHTGLPAVSELDTVALQSLYEFMQKGVGQAVSGWDKFGLSSELSTLSSLVDIPENETPPDTPHETHIVTLKVSGESIAIFVTLKEVVENVLMGKTVLVADDSRMIRMILTRAFEKQGCRVIEAVDGQNAIEKFYEGQPDLTIMDMVMPQMDGFEAIGKIRETAPEAKVLVLTSFAGKKEIMAAASLGISGYIRKPVKPEKLIETAVGCFR